jgi:ABC-2 type transport system permease protein
MLLQYRAAAIAGVWTQGFFGLVLVMVYEAFYRSVTAPQPMTFAEVVSYVWLGQALLAMFPWNTDGEIRTMVRNGAVAYELCRPIDLYALWYVRALAWRTAPTILRAVPMCLIAAVVLPLVGLGEWRLAGPPSAAAALAFGATLAGTLLLGCAMTTLLHISLLWTISGEGAVLLLTTLSTFLSGMIVPLPLFPGWMQPIVQALPFAGLVDGPFRVFTGHIPPGDAGSVLRHQIAWTIALVVFGRWLLARGLRRLVVQGG